MFDYLNIIPLFTILILIAGTAAAIFIKPHKFKNTRTSVFISIMGSMAVIILSLNVVLTTVSLETQNTINKAQFTKQAIDKLWLFPNQLLKEATHARPEFIASLYYNNNNLYHLTLNKKTVPTVKSEMEEQYISLVLIQSWEDYLTLREFDHTGAAVWIHNFLQWAQSPYLKKVYDNLKFNFAQTTIDLGDLLFEYAQQIPVPSQDSKIYQMTVKKFLKDPRLHAIFKATGH